VRRMIRAAAAVLAGLVLALPTAVPAEATPGPNNEEWWFDSMAIQQVAWPHTEGKGVTVAVLDTGVNASLPEFRGGVVLPGINLKGGGGDGRQDGDPQNGHGTGMASLIAAQGGGPNGWVGVAPGAKILPIKVNIGDWVTTPKAIHYAVDHKAKIISISQGSAAVGQSNGCPQEIQDAVIYAAQHDVVILAAAGNSGDGLNEPEYPSGCPGVVGVGAFDHNGDPWKQTQRQSYVAVSGPGAQVSSLGKDGRLYHYGNGTSQATAIAAGAVALIRAKFPNESARRIVQRIIATATDVGLPGRDDQLGYGAVSLRHAMTANVPSSAPNPVYERLDKVLAAQKKQPSAEREPAASGKTSSSHSSVLLVVGGVVVLVVILLVVFLISRSRRRPSGRVGQAPVASGYGQYPQHGAPPSFGPPHPQGSPPNHAFPPNASPPRIGGQPSFEPPRDPGPPPEQRSRPW
jgi:type VII secretion-associated serine protease mycosin